MTSQERRMWFGRDGKTTTPPLSPRGADSRVARDMVSRAVKAWSQSPATLGLFDRFDLRMRGRVKSFTHIVSPAPIYSQVTT